MDCAFCRGVLNVSGEVVRSDTCPHCKRDLRCCKQCKSFDPKAYNQCREVHSQRIMDKERANQCEHFALRGSPEKSSRGDKVKEARKALEALFKKK